MKYIGMSKTLKQFIAFSNDTEPTECSHGELYSYVIGPFKTTRAQKWAVMYGKNNPHFQHISDAERISRGGL